MSTILIFVALFVSLIGTAYLYVKNAFTYWKRQGIPSIPPTFPFGNCKEIFLQTKSMSDLLQKFYESSKEPVLGIYSAIFPMLLIRDPKIIRNILITDFSSFHNRSSTANEEVDPMAANMLLQNDEKWKTARTQLSPAFSSGKLKAMFGAIIGATESLNEFIGQYADYQTKPVEIREVFARYATNVIASIAFGIEIDCIKNPNSEFRTYGKRIFEMKFINALRSMCIFFVPSLSRLLRVRFTDKDVGDFMINIVKENSKYREENNIVRKDFFQMLMQLRNTGKIKENDDHDWSIKSTNIKKSLSLEEISAQAFLFFAASYESSSSTMSFCMYELATNADTQQKAYEEIVSVLERHNGQLTYESVGEMKYLDNCINEVLRLHSPFGVLDRRCMKDYNVPNTNIVIKKGTQIMISVAGIQHDPQYYEEPYKFKPERFAENKAFLEMPFLAFGDGQRNCLGLRLGKLQSKIAIIKVLQKFRFELSEQHLNKELEMSPKTVVKSPINGINLNVFTR